MDTKKIKIPDTHFDAGSHKSSDGNDAFPISNGMNDYQTIAKVIDHIIDHTLEQQSLEKIAQTFDVSPGYLQKTFTTWVGISPKQFAQYLSCTYAKQLLATRQTTEQTSTLTGLSSSGRLHDLFVTIEAMSPGEYKTGAVVITYSIAVSPFGHCLIATTQKGVCNILFADSPQGALSDLKCRWPNATYTEASDPRHHIVREYLTGINPQQKIKLHVHGTNFQTKIWEALLTIPEGAVATYGDVAEIAGDRKNARAAGAAIGDNPIGYLIPCHRILKSTGAISGYHWGVTRKRAMLMHEAIRTHETYEQAG